MSYIEWSTQDKDIWCNLSVSSKGDEWWAEVELDHQTIALGNDKTDTEAIRLAIVELNERINQLIKIKSEMVYYLVQKESK